MTRRVAFTDPHLHTFEPALTARLAECGARLEVRRCPDEDELIAFCAGAEVVIATAARITARVIGRLAGCRLIIRTGTGYDTIDLRAAGAAGIPVANVPGFSTDDVADHTMALLLACVRKIAWLDRRVRLGDWTPDGAMPVRRLAGRTLGLVGFGAIGRAVAARAAGFGLSVIYHDPLYQPVADAPAARACASLDELLAEADIVSLHVPLTDATRGLIAQPQLERMKRDAVLINTARGGLVVEEDLARVLAAGRIAGAGLDVLAAEPPQPNSPLVTMENVVITPHAAAYTEDALADLRTRVIDEVVRALRGEPLRHVVNREFLGPRDRP